jgi:hypothetical protein
LQVVGQKKRAIEMKNLAVDDEVEKAERMKQMLLVQAIEAMRVERKRKGRG